MLARFKNEENEWSHESVKIACLGLIFFLIIASYTIIKELKDSLFIGLIGEKELVPLAKMGTILGFIPLVFLYSKLVDRVRRYQILCVCASLYSVLGLVSAYVISTSGMVMIGKAPYFYKVFGWVYYFFVESFSPFVVTVFWSFLNSVSSPGEAKKSYGILTSASKVGGMLSAGLAWFLLANNHTNYGLGLSESAMHTLLMVVSSLMLACVPFVILKMMKIVPGKYLHGYEAAYKFEKQQSKQESNEAGIFSGLSFLVRYPYALGILATVVFYEMVNAILGYIRLGVAQNSSGNNVCDFSCYLFKIIFFTHLVGFFISFFGTGFIMRRCGERLSLIMLPLCLGVALLYLLFNYSPDAIIIVLVVLRAIYYGFDQPVRESLYIPTVKAIKFKSKSWTDTFGKKIARGFGSSVNVITSRFGPALSNNVYVGFFGILIGAWLLVAYLLGKRYSRAIKHNEVIGSDDGTDE